MLWLWLGGIVAFAVLEAATAGMVAVWFVAGAVGALLATALGAPVWLQLLVFALVSAATLALLRPLAAKLSKPTPTNADRVIGKLGKVMETIDNDNSAGAVYVDGKTWTARSVSGEILEKDTLIRVSRIEGVTLYVKSSKEDLLCPSPSSSSSS